MSHTFLLTCVIILFPGCIELNWSTVREKPKRKGTMAKIKCYGNVDYIIVLEETRGTIAVEMISKHADASQLTSVAFL